MVKAAAKDREFRNPLLLTQQVMADVHDGFDSIDRLAAIMSMAIPF